MPPKVRVKVESLTRVISKVRRLKTRKVSEMQQELGKIESGTVNRSLLRGLGAAAVAGAMILLPVTATNAQLRSGETPVVTPVPGAPATFADLVSRVKPAVVSIRVTAGGRASRPRERRNTPRRPGARPFPDLPGDHPLNEFFRNLPRANPGAPGRRQPQRRRRAQGSGFVISADGYVVTNNHVIRGANKISVSFEGKENLPAKLIGTDPRTDLALLKIQSKKTFPFVRFASGKSREGDWVVAVGNPFGLGGTVTAGIVSALARDIGSGPYDFLQIDAAVNRGNSGGPTFNMKGEVIGVNTAIYSPSGGNVGIAFAVPAKTASEVIEQLKKSGSVKRGWLGVKIQNVTQDIADGLGLSEARGALISEVTANGPAQKSGLRGGDAILSVDGKRIEDSRDLARKIAEFDPSTSVEIGIRRGNRNMTIDVKLGTFPGGATAPAKVDDPAKETEATALRDLGLKLRANTKGKGVVIADVDADTDAAEKGLRKGDIILEVNSAIVNRPSDVDREVKKAKNLGRKAVLMTVMRGKQRRFIAVQLKPKKG